jgi:hypothetical protein
MTLSHETTAMRVGLIACLALVAGTANTQVKPRTVSEVVSSSSDAVVQIVVSDSTGKETALGSGFIVSADGRIVTNYHVIKGAHSAIVRLTNGAFFPVQGVLATDAEKDLALLKVNGKNLPFLVLGAADNFHVGDHVVAIGSPLGLEGTVSDGIISALREVGGKNWIQTTAPVSHGNSGGPLLDMNGNVVGVITWGYLQLGENLNFAVPANEASGLLSSAHEPRSLDNASHESVLPSVAARSDKLWTSLTTGRDYKVRQDGDYLYSEWINLPSQYQGTAAFSRFELKKDSDGRWRGKSRTFLPCQYNDSWTGQSRVNWCRIETDCEVDRMSDTRIEGISLKWEKFDCRKCQPKESTQMPFTWIPKD